LERRNPAGNVEFFVELIVDIVGSNTKFSIQSDPLTQIFGGVVSDILIKWVWDQVTILSLVAMEQGAMTEDIPVVENTPMVEDTPVTVEEDLHLSDTPPISTPTPPTPTIPAVPSTVVPEISIPPPVPEIAPERIASPFVEVDTDEFEWDVIDKSEAHPNSHPSLFNFTIPRPS
jgi:hypothetical protein